MEDNDLILVNRDNTNYQQTKDKLMAELLDDDLLLVNRDDKNYKITGKELKDSVESATGVIISAPSLVADSVYAPSTLTVTAAVVENATKDATYNNWYKDGVAIAGTAEQLVYTATSAGVYKYEERWVGNDAAELKPKAEVTIDELTIATPTVITPPDGAGEGDGTSYTPETSAVTQVQGISESASPFDTGYNGSYTYSNSNFTASYNGVSQIARTTQDIGSLNTSTGLSDKTNWKFEVFGDVYNGIGYLAGDSDRTMSYLGYTADSIGFMCSPTGTIDAYTNAATIKNVSVDSLSTESIITTQYDFDNRVVYLWVDGTYVDSFGWVPTSVSESIRPAVGSNSTGTQTTTALDIQNTTLTFTNNKAYDSSDGTEKSTIDQTFKAGTKVVGKGTPDYTDTITRQSDCFGTKTFEGTGNPMEVNTGIDNTIKSLIWFKNRDTTYPHLLFDTERGINSRLSTDNNQIAQEGESDVTAFTSTGVNLQNKTGWINNISAPRTVAWNFRAAPGFMDIVTWNGNGVAGTEIPHSLGTKPSCLIFKSTTNTGDWSVHHTGLSRFDSSNWWNNKIWLNQSSAENSTGSGDLNNTEPSDASFTLSDSSDVNGTNRSYVAYLFADTPGLIKCGEYEGDGQATQTINVGFKPAWILYKGVDDAHPWLIYDGKRTNAQGNAYLQPHLNAAEDPNHSYLTITDTGFQVDTINYSGEKIIYIAIAENAQAGQMLPSRTAFNTLTYTGSGGAFAKHYTGINNKDNKALVWIKGYDGTGFNSSIHNHLLMDSERENYQQYLITSKTEKATDSTIIMNPLETGYQTKQGAEVCQVNTQFVSWNFRAASKFFDIVTYEGDGVDGRKVPHNLDANIGALIVKCTTADGTNWNVWHRHLPETERSLYLNSDQQMQTANRPWGSPAYITNEHFTVNNYLNINSLDEEYVAYVFAEDTTGLIKCGQYLGDASSGNFIDVGFKPGWVMIKSTGTAGKWVIQDNERTALLYANSSAAQDSPTAGMVSFNDNGFQINNYANTDINALDEQYIYVAIAENANADYAQPTGVLTENADASGPSMTLSNVTGIWAKGLTAVSETEITETAPDADEITFTSSKPATTAGTVTTWGTAEWELKDLGTNVTQTKSVTLQDSNTENGPTDFTLEGDTNYEVRVRYSSSNPPSRLSEWSTANSFKTADDADPEVVPEGQVYTYLDESTNLVPWTSPVKAINLCVGTPAFIVGEDNKIYSSTSDAKNFTDFEATTGYTRGANNKDVWVPYVDSGELMVCLKIGGAAVAYNGSTPIPLTGKTVKRLIKGGGITHMVIAETVDGEFWTWCKDAGRSVGTYKIGSALIWEQVSFTLPNGANVKTLTGVNGNYDMAALIILGDDGKLYGSAESAYHAGYSGISFAGSNTSPILVTAGGADSKTFVDVRTCTSSYSYQASFTALTDDGELWCAEDTSLGANAFGGTVPTFASIGDGWLSCAASAYNTTKTTPWYALKSNGEIWGDSGGTTAVKANLGVNTPTNWRTLGGVPGAINTYDNSDMLLIIVPETTLFYDEVNGKAVCNYALTDRYGVDPLKVNLSKQGIYPLTEQPTYPTAGYERQLDGKYKPIESFEDRYEDAEAEAEKYLNYLRGAACLWVVDKVYEAGEVVQFNGKLYKALVNAVATTDTDPGDETDRWEDLGISVNS